MLATKEKARRSAEEISAIKSAAGKKGGRPPGAVTSRHRRRINQLVCEHETPVDVMFDNMLFWHRRVREFAPELEEMMATTAAAVARTKPRADGDDVDPEEYTEALRLARATNELAEKFLYARERSQSCAVDAAPYCHPRLQAIAIQMKNSNELKVTGGLPDMPVEAGEAILEGVAKTVT